jgi:hypothetical protein
MPGRFWTTPRIVLAGGTVVFALGLVLLLRWFAGGGDALREKAELERAVPDFYKPLEQRWQLRGPELEAPAIKPRMLAIRVDEETGSGSLHSWLDDELDEDLGARRISEVKTLALVVSNTPFTFMSGGGSYTSDVTVAVVDLESSTVIGRKRFQGPPPPSRITHEELLRSNERFWGAVITYLDALPRH